MNEIYLSKKDCIKYGSFFLQRGITVRQKNPLKLFIYALVFAFILFAIPSISNAFTLTPNTGTSFETVIDDYSYSVLVCSPSGTCSTINSGSGASDQCAYIDSGTLSSNSGQIGSGFYSDESGQPDSPCDESEVGVWKVRQYTYGGSFSWASDIVTFTVTSGGGGPDPEPETPVDSSLFASPFTSLYATASSTCVQTSSGTSTPMTYECHATSTPVYVQDAGNVSFALSILIGLVFIMVAGFMYNNMTSKKPWL